MKQQALKKAIALVRSELDRVNYQRGRRDAVLIALRLDAPNRAEIVGEIEFLNKEVKVLRITLDWLIEQLN